MGWSTSKLIKDLHGSKYSHLTENLIWRQKIQRVLGQFVYTSTKNWLNGQH